MRRGTAALSRPFKGLNLVCVFIGTETDVFARFSSLWTKAIIALG